MAAYLLDTNILLRSSDPASSNYTQAVQAVSSLLANGEQISVTPQNLIEFWAVATRPLEANGFGWSPQTTASQVQQILDQFPLLEDVPSIFNAWLDLVTSVGILGKKVHDARLVAVMQAHGVTHLLTFNTQDFKMYPGISVMHPDDIV